MPLATQAGRYRALPTGWNVAESGPNKLVTFTCSFRLMQRFDPDSDTWIDCRERDESVRGYFYLQQRDGSANASAVRQLCEALAWSGLDLAELQDADHKNTQVELVLDFEEYQGKRRLRIKWLNRPGQSMIARSNDTAIAAMQAQLGDQLRALADDAGPSNEAAPPATTPAPIADEDIPF